MGEFKAYLQVGRELDEVCRRYGLQSVQVNFIDLHGRAHQMGSNLDELAAAHVRIDQLTEKVEKIVNRAKGVSITPEEYLKSRG